MDTKTEIKHMKELLEISRDMIETNSRMLKTSTRLNNLIKEHMENN